MTTEAVDTGSRKNTLGEDHRVFSNVAYSQGSSLHDDPAVHPGARSAMDRAMVVVRP